MSACHKGWHFFYPKIGQRSHFVN